MHIHLKGKTALVAGSTQGIGKATAIELSKTGANIILLARNEAKLKETLELLDVSQNQKHQYLVADFANPDHLKNSLESLQTEVHILVNNTGGPPAGQAISAQTQEFIQAFNSHLICNQILVQKVVDSMKQAQYGRIINIISTSVKQPIKGLGVSNTIRGAVANWAKTLSVELAPFGITVNNVLPGATLTGRLEAIIEKTSQNKQISQEEASQEMQKEIPCGRFGTPEEIAYGVVFLASQQAAYINGTNLVIDGGRTQNL
ncbi:MAG: SDR family oxidoreductase [Raineya sp.]|jgi:3-oxoacyl-[acyl-carrier protein] reductase|nr:SDR family oxidoreductase [Raineya sp.]